MEFKDFEQMTPHWEQPREHFLGELHYANVRPSFLIEIELSEETVELYREVVLAGLLDIDELSARSLLRRERG